MPKFELTSPDGKKYQVEGPEGATPEQAYDILQQQLKGQSGNTQGGDLLRGLGHGAMSSFGPSAQAEADKLMGSPEGAGAWRQTGETVGGAVPPLATGLIPGGPIVKGLAGAGVGALQPADSWTRRAENAGIGALSAYGGGKLAASPGVKTALDHLANMGLGMVAGPHLGEMGRVGGLWAGRAVGREIEHMFGGGLGDLIGWLAKNPGLAASMGVKAVPAINTAGSYVGTELGKPSQ
jgi:hypothetical protein